MKKKLTTNAITRGAIIAALYVVLTFVSNLFGIANGVIQVRLSEGLTLLPIFFPEAIGGLTVGCFLANLLTGCLPVDMLLGTIATFIGAVGTYVLRKNKFFATLSPIVVNAIIIPLTLKLFYNVPFEWWYVAIAVAIGEIISCGVIGNLVNKFVEKTLV